MSNKLAVILKEHEELLSKDKFMKRFEDVLNKNAAAFVTSVLNMIKNSESLQECDKMTIWNAALTAATMNLSVDPNFGQAYIIPYNCKDGGKWVKKAQFQLGYRGYKELARRSGVYKHLNVTDVREGEIKRRNRLTGEIEFEFIEDDETREKAEITGYLSYIEYKDGTSYQYYMTIPELKSHAARYSKTYQNDLKNGTKTSKWSDDESFGRMCEKTVTKLNLSRNGVLSVENHLIEAAKMDGAVINDIDNGDILYIETEQEKEVSESERKLADINEKMADIETAETTAETVETAENTVKPEEHPSAEEQKEAPKQPDNDDQPPMPEEPPMLYSDRKGA